MTDSMVERVARAILRNRVRLDLIERGEDEPLCEAGLELAVDRLWNGASVCDGEERETYREDARAALEAMQEITSAMLRAGKAASDWPGSPSAIYHAMITAALKGRPEGQ